MTTEEELVAAKNRVKERLFAIPGVMFVGVGGKEVDGVLTREPAVKVLVREKLPASALPAAELIPSDVEGVPTDVVAIGGVVPLTSEQPPGMLNPALWDQSSERARDLKGGYCIGVENAGGLGTLGCVLKDQVDEWKVYALTCQHVITHDGKFNPVPLVSKVGQPTGSDGICCSDIFGVYETGALSSEKDEASDRDEGLLRIHPGRTWKPAIRGIGEITGVHTITPFEASVENYQVRKVGARTGKTGGTVTGLFDTPQRAENLLLVKPNPHPAQHAYDTLHFAYQGDSGSAMVNDLGTTDPDGKPVVEVVGLIYAIAASSLPFLTFVLPIQKVIERFFAHEGLLLTVATIRNSHPVNTVPKPPPGSLDPLAGAPADGVPAALGHLAGLQQDLEGSPAGRLLHALWRDHREELAGLVRHNRRVTVAWHRGGGPGLVQLLIRLPRQAGLALPETLAGRPVDECVDQLHREIREHAGPALKTALDRAHSALPRLAGLTYPQLIDALARA
ncbi:hypothetical protein ACTVZO_36215 [Streptomyces sp. IBSNAI002]|uniref:hypothetical protein n=1 Tax=Streptomyces sp. IBSNAI002 TaxID=3457500 RepID=UPI003FD17337